jgi:hypothetical protein
MSWYWRSIKVGLLEEGNLGQTICGRGRGRFVACDGIIDLMFGETLIWVCLESRGVAE